MKKKYLLAGLVACMFSALGAGAEAKRPNVLVVMVDDLGFSDIGCYGSEIETPNLDQLAADGLRFSQFYNTAKCHSSRVSLMSGMYCMQAGDVKLNRAVTSAEVLRESGYFTMMTGKWHLDKEPTDFGFDRFFGHLSGACNYFSGDDTFRLNAEPWKVPETDFYTTVANVDFALDFLQEARATDKPWYLYVAFNAPHAPLQPLEEDYRKYEGRYDAGWDVMREQRVEKLKTTGLFSDDMVVSPRPDHVLPWEQLSPEWQGFERNRMTALAGLIDRVDQEIGRLIADLKAAGEFENTFILFVSDNGACPYDRRSHPVNAEPFKASTTWNDSTGWAWARNTPFQYYKQNQYEGGICTPAIVHWPAGLKTEPGAVVDDPAHLIDVLPTLADICDAPIPREWPGRDLKQVSGVSIAPIFEGQGLTNRPPIHLLFGRDRGLRDGDWKLVSFRRQPWALYNIADDRTELNDLAAHYPERVEQMVQQWQDIAEHVLEAPAGNRRPVDKDVRPHSNPEWSFYEGEPGVSAKEARKASTQPSAKTPAPKKEKKSSIRARKDTKMAINGSQLELTCTGDDPGIAINSIGRVLPPGPYMLSFRIRSNAGGKGEVYYTEDPNAKLPSGSVAKFRVQHNDEWQDITVRLDTQNQLHALRLDPCSQPGKVTISDLTLKDATGGVLAQWPAK